MSDIKKKVQEDKNKKNQFTLDKFYSVPTIDFNKNKNMKELKSDNLNINIISWNVNGLRSMFEKGVLNEIFTKGKFLFFLFF